LVSRTTPPELLPLLLLEVTLLPLLLEELVSPDEELVEVSPLEDEPAPELLLLLLAPPSAAAGSAGAGSSPPQ
jgi:hypothetical protein